MTRRLTGERRVQGERKDSVNKERLKLIDELRMQARSNCAVNRMMKVEPREPENSLEWRVANFLEKHK